MRSGVFDPSRRDRVFWFQYQLVARSSSLPDRPPHARFRNFGAQPKVPFGPGNPDCRQIFFPRDPSIGENRESTARRIRVAVMTKVCFLARDVSNHSDNAFDLQPFAFSRRPDRCAHIRRAKTFKTCPRMVISSIGMVNYMNK
jgi:hypothetical protein